MARQSARHNTAPSIPVYRAVELLQKQVKESDEVIRLQYDDPRVDAWESTTASVLTAAFGSPNGDLHPNTSEFKYAHRGSLHVNMEDSELQRNHVATQTLRKTLLAGFVEQLQLLAPPSAVTAYDQYRFHPDIERCSGQLYRDGHHEQAALAAYICVIDAVKKKTGLARDGDDLMNHAFKPERPAIQVNALQTDADVNEQKGFMFLFKGLVGLRNLKAHTNRPFSDPGRAHEYLALSSLLLRIVEMSRANPVASVGTP